MELATEGEDRPFKDRRKRRITLTAVAATVASLGIIWAAARVLVIPALVTASMDVMGEEISRRAETQAKPANQGVKSMLSKDIKRLQGEVRFELLRKAQTPIGKWTQLDEMKLANLEDQLEVARIALTEFENAAKEALKEIGK